MAKTHYLGGTSTTQHRKPGQLILTKPIDTLTAGEMDLLLLRQKLEIQQLNADKTGIGGVGNFGEVMKTVNHCIRHANNPDHICAIGEALANGYSVDEAVGASAKKMAKKAANAAKKKETGKTAAGRLLQKVGKGIKTGAKAIVKVVTAPLRLIAKGAMEIYLPKAAPFFLYLFAANPDALPDMMKRKRKKAEKFRNFVVKGLGMKEDHFMKIVSNGLEKQYGKEPAQYLAEKLVTRVSGIGNPKKQWRMQCDQMISGIGKKEKPPKRKEVKPKPVKKLVPKAQENYNTTLKSPVKSPDSGPVVKAPDLTALQQKTQNNLEAAREKAGFKLEPDKLIEAGEKLASGNVIGAAMQAISWLISKISSIFKGEKMDPITAEDFPDVERDAAQVFDYEDMKEDYGGLDIQRKKQVKEVAAELAGKKLSLAQITEAIANRLSFLNKNQQKEVADEVWEGPEALDEYEGRRLSRYVTDDEPTGWMADERELDNVLLPVRKKTAPTPFAENNNGIMIAALAAVAIIAMSKK